MKNISKFQKILSNTFWILTTPLTSNCKIDVLRRKKHALLHIAYTLEDALVYWQCLPKKYTCNLKIANAK